MEDRERWVCHYGYQFTDTASKSDSHQDDDLHVEVNEGAGSKGL